MPVFLLPLIPILIGVGEAAIAALAGTGIALGVPALTVGAAIAGAGTGAAVAGTGAAVGSATNPFIADGVRNAATDAYNNAVTGSANAANTLNLPVLPGVFPR